LWKFVGRAVRCHSCSNRRDGLDIRRWPCGAVCFRLMVERAAALLAAAHHAVVLTGAGVSAESGIPTFRGEGGLWTKYDPVKVSSIDSFLADPASYWRVSKQRGTVAMSALPNA